MPEIETAAQGLAGLALRWKRKLYACLSKRLATATLFLSQSELVGQLLLCAHMRIAPGLLSGKCQLTRF